MLHVIATPIGNLGDLSPRAQGLPDEMVGRATERMARINAAWGEVKAARGL